MDIENLTVLIGKNDVGKSNLLHAINILLDGAGITNRDFRQACKECSISGKFQVPSELKDELKKVLNIECDELEIEIKSTLDTKSGKLQSKYYVNKKSNIKTFKQIKPYLPNPLLIEAFHNPEDEFSISNRDTLLSQLLLPIIETKSEEKEQTKNVRILKEKLLQAIKEETTSIRDQLLSNLKKMWEDIEDISIDINELNLKNAIKPILVIKDKHYSNEQSVTQRGSGLQRSLILALLNVYRNHKIGEGWILLFEEPEIHLHADAQRKLLAILKSIADKGQVIISTHSPIFINNLNSKSHKLYLLTKKDGKTILKTEIDYSKIRDELGIQPSDALYAHGIIVVEGPHDSQIVKAWCEQLFDDWLECNIAVLHGGGSSVPKLVGSLISDNINENLVVILDGDGAGNKIKERIEKFNDTITVLQWQKDGTPKILEEMIDPTIDINSLNDKKEEIICKGKKYTRDEIPKEAQELLKQAKSKLINGK